MGRKAKSITDQFHTIYLQISMFYQLKIGVTSTEPKLRFLLKNQPMFLFQIKEKSPRRSANILLDPNILKEFWKGKNSVLRLSLEETH